MSGALIVRPLHDVAGGIARELERIGRDQHVGTGEIYASDWDAP